MNQSINQSTNQSINLLLYGSSKAGLHGLCGLLADRILHLNMDGLSAAERSIIRDIAERHINVDVICFQALTKFEGRLNLLHEAKSYC